MCLLPTRPPAATGTTTPGLFDPAAVKYWATYSQDFSPGCVTSMQKLPVVVGGGGGGRGARAAGGQGAQVMVNAVCSVIR